MGLTAHWQFRGPKLYGQQVTATLIDADAQVAKCHCGKDAGCVLIGSATYVALCAACTPGQHNNEIEDDGIRKD